MEYLQGSGMKAQVYAKPVEIIPFKNGLLNLDTMKLSAHTSDYFTVNVIPHNYDPNAKCPEWIKFLSEVHQPQDIHFIQEWWGYNLWTEVPRSAFAIFEGGGNNGKTVELRTMENIIGLANITNISIQMLNINPFMAAEVYLKLSNISDDMPYSSMRNISFTKQVSSGTPITVHRKNGQPFQITPYAKITYSTNEPPRIWEDDDALWDRMKVIPFLNHFSENPNPAKGEKLAKDREIFITELTAETSGIINWAIEGLQRLRNNNFRFSYPLTPKEVKKYYLYHSSSVFAFLEDRIIKTGNSNDIIPVQIMADAYDTWCQTTFPKNIKTRREFFNEMHGLGYETRAFGSVSLYKGVKYMP